MPHFPEAHPKRIFKLDGLPGYYEKITGKEAKEDGHKQHVKQAIYGDGSLGHFVPIAVDTAKPPATAKDPRTAEQTPPRKCENPADDASPQSIEDSRAEPMAAADAANS